MKPARPTEPKRDVEEARHPWAGVDAAVILGLTILWCIPALWIGVEGEFPISDDWAYAFATERFIETGQIERLDWTFVPMLPNAWIGAAFSWWFGFSFETLRLSNLVMGWTGLLGCYVLVRECNAAPGRAAFGAALYGFNPLHMALTFTFMTDVTFISLVTWGLVFLVRGLARARWLPFLLGLGLTVLACLSRQFAAMILPGVVCALSWGGIRGIGTAAQQRLRQLGFSGLGLGVLAVLVFAARPFGDDATGLIAGNMRLYAWMIFDTPHVGFFVFQNLVWFSVYLGLLLLPLAFFPGHAAGRWMLLTIGALAAGGMAGLYAATPLRMPFALDIINATYLGWNTLAGAGSTNPPHPAFWFVVAALGLMGALLLAFPVIREFLVSANRRAIPPERILLLGFSAFYLVFLLPRWPCFDRYLLTVVPPLAAVISTLPNPLGTAVRRDRLLGGLALVCLAAIGVLGARDNMAHHRARWSLLDPLLATGVPPVCVDGGFELAGWKSYDGARRHQDRPLIIGEDWQVTMAAKRADYTEVRQVQYWRSLPPGRETLRLLRRAELPSDCEPKIAPTWPTH